MKKPKVKDYTFTRGQNLFDETVVMIHRNSDKKHIISIGEEHVIEMISNGYNPDDQAEVLEYLQRNTRLLN